MMEEEERYQRIDLPFYRSKIAPILPAEVLDFHAHAWKREHFYEIPWESGKRGGKYMVTETDYGIDQLMEDGKRIFADRPYNAVCFGYPSPVANHEASNNYLSTKSQKGIYPLMLITRDKMTYAQIKESIVEGGFFGFKVILPWIGNDYGNVRIQDMIGPTEMNMANNLGLVVLIHVPRSGRLADPEIQREVREYARRYPNASIVLAHCGRCYHPDVMKVAVEAIRDLDNVYVDTAMVMDPVVFQILFREIDSRRVLYGTDFPVATMRGRRVYVMNHWVDVVTEGYPVSSFRAISSDMNATFMAYEIVLALKRAADLVGLPMEKLRAIFYENGMAVLRHVMGGRQLKNLQSQ